MSRTYRKNSFSSWRDLLGEYRSEPSRDGRSCCKAKELTKWHSRWKRRNNDKKIIIDYLKGVDPDEIEYKDDRNLRYVLWCYD